MTPLRMTRRKVLLLVPALAGLWAADRLMAWYGNREGPIEEIASGLVTPARAVVGRPLTPVSYAGVARRTSRRTARRTATRY